MTKVAILKEMLNMANNLDRQGLMDAATEVDKLAHRFAVGMLRSAQFTSPSGAPWGRSGPPPPVSPPTAPGFAGFGDTNSPLLDIPKQIAAIDKQIGDTEAALMRLRMEKAKLLSGSAAYLPGNAADADNYWKAYNLPKPGEAGSGFA
jgi:hypothetical protein